MVDVTDSTLIHINDLPVPILIPIPIYNTKTAKKQHGIPLSDF